MGKQLYRILLKICLLWLTSIPTSLTLKLKTMMPNEIDLERVEKVYVQPSELVMRDKNEKPMIYYFITDYPPPNVPTNNYIKPWEVVASKPIRVKNIDDGRTRILRKNNILYLEKANNQ